MSEENDAAIRRALEQSGREPPPTRKPTREEMRAIVRLAMSSMKEGGWDYLCTRLWDYIRSRP